MKTLPFILLLTAFSGAALASEQDNAQACLSWGINKMAQNPESERLKDLTITNINTERYDEKIGSQHIATQLAATLEKKEPRRENALFAGKRSTAVRLL